MGSSRCLSPSLCYWHITPLGSAGTPQRGFPPSCSAPHSYSGAAFTCTGELLLLLGVVALFIEIVKATRSSMASAVDHALSALVVFAAYLVEFLLVKAAAPACSWC